MAEVYAQLPLIGQTKRCTKCDKPKPLSDYAKHKTNNDGLQYWCRQCQTAHRAAWRVAHPGRDKETQRRWNRENPGVATIRHREYVAAHRDEINAYQRERLEAKPELRERHRQHENEVYAANREENQTKDRAYYAETKERRREIALETYRRHREDPTWTQKEWLRLNDRARKRYELTATITPETEAYLGIIADDCCVYCGGPASTIEHIVPISRGGTHEWDNLDRACSTCNTSRGNRPLLLFLLSRWK